MEWPRAPRLHDRASGRHHGWPETRNDASACGTISQPHPERAGWRSALMISRKSVARFRPRRCAGDIRGTAFRPARNAGHAASLSWCPHPAFESRPNPSENLSHQISKRGFNRQTADRHTYVHVLRVEQHGVGHMKI